MRRNADLLPSPPGGGAGGEGRPGSVPSVADLMREAAARLQAALGLERREARLEAQILIARALGVERAWLIAHDRDALTPDQASAIEALLARRASGEPVAYILGEREFFGRVFRVTPDVLIPRPETELLVEAALDRLPPDRPARILDLGTGSGCIAITLALERPDCVVTAVDVCPAALAVACENAVALGTRVELIASDWFSRLGGRSFELIIANPPYVPSGAVELGQGDVRFEPRRALAAGAAGLDDMGHLISAAPCFLSPGGWLLLEHGWDQASTCCGLMEMSGFMKTRSLRDLAGHTRISLGQFHLARQECRKILRSSNKDSL